MSQHLSDSKEPTRSGAEGTAFWVERASGAKALGQDQALLFRGGQ